MFRKNLEVKTLAEDIMKNGQNPPIFVRPKEDDHYQIISGFRRTAALKEIVAKEALVRVFHIDAEQAHRLAISENFQRQDFSEMERAMVCKRLRDVRLDHQVESDKRRGRPRRGRKGS